MKFIIIAAALTSLSSFALECESSNGDKLVKVNNSKWTLSSEDIDHELTGKSYSIDYNTKHSILKDLDQNTYSLISNTSFGISHCRHRVCPPVPSKVSLKLSKNDGLYDYFTCL